MLGLEVGLMVDPSQLHLATRVELDELSSDLPRPRLANPPVKGTLSDMTSPLASCWQAPAHLEKQSRPPLFGTKPRQNQPMTTNVGPPSHEALASDLAKLQLKGLTQLRTLWVPALTAASQIVITDDTMSEAAAIEETVRQAVEKIADRTQPVEFSGRIEAEPWASAIGCLFGFEPGTRGLSSRERREKAGDRIGKSAVTVARRYQTSMFVQVADQILAFCAEQAMRDARVRRDPSHSQLAVSWLERFEAYSSVGQAALALAAELTAYRWTLIEANARQPDERAEKAVRYAQAALYRYAVFDWTVERRMNDRYGGLWLFSSFDTETTAVDAVYRITWYVRVFDAKDDSWLRSALEQTPGRELYGFLEYLENDETGKRLYEKWLNWLTACECTWRDDALADEAERFPTWRHHAPGITETCQVHNVIAYCNTYCDLVEADFLKIADWYHLEPFDRRLPQTVTGSRLYLEEKRKQGQKETP
jgi:hypothetical protein